MPKKTKAAVYTRSGDKKVTTILGGFRISKRSARIEAIGSLDELNSFLGFLLTLPSGKIRFPLHKIIGTIQNDLFVIGAELSQPIIKQKGIPHPFHRHYPNAECPKARKVPTLTPKQIHAVEDWIDQFHSELPPLKNFIVPQGNSASAFLQIVRAICRRTERRVVQLATYSKIDPLIIAYLNRLSDLFFVLSRAINHACKGREKVWQPSIDNVSLKDY